MTPDNRPIGVFDSGAGGISVLREMRRIMPGERFAYFGDSLHTPYGDKPIEWIRDQSADIVSLLADGLDAKAVVIACNTATAAAADALRAARDDIPIFGIEPALKPAATENPGGTVLVMATEATLRLDRFRLLVDQWGTGCAVVSVPCPGLADAIEDGLAGTPEMSEMVRGFVGDWAGHDASVVLGCTHYPFVEAEIRSVLGSGTRIYDGADGTARNVRDTLARRGALSDGRHGWGSPLDLVDTFRRQAVHPNVWCSPDAGLLLMTSGTIRHVVRYESLMGSRPFGAARNGARRTRPCIRMADDGALTLVDGRLAEATASEFA